MVRLMIDTHHQCRTPSLAHSAAGWPAMRSMTTSSKRKLHALHIQAHILSQVPPATPISPLQMLARPFSSAAAQQHSRRPGTHHTASARAVRAMPPLWRCRGAWQGAAGRKRSSCKRCPSCLRGCWLWTAMGHATCGGLSCKHVLQVRTSSAVS